MALSNVCPKNTASFTISKMIKEIKIKFEDITRLISYQDKDVHNGTIYKASNWFVASEVPLLEWNTKTRKRNKLQSNSKKIRWEYQI